jgi:hypothetical protein
LFRGVHCQGVSYQHNPFAADYVLEGRSSCWFWGQGFRYCRISLPSTSIRRYRWWLGLFATGTVNARSHRVVRDLAL